LRKIIKGELNTLSPLPEFGEHSAHRMGVDPCVYRPIGDQNAEMGRIASLCHKG
jgi:hypothetical protein